MGTKVGPNIAKDGLVLYLDASTHRSYPQTGSTWYDLSDAGNNVPIANGVGHSNYIEYDNSATSFILQNLSRYDQTIECTFNPVSSYAGCCNTIFGTYYFRFFLIENQLYTMIGVGYPDGGYNTYQHPAYNISLGNWHHCVGMRRDNRYVIWIDGVERYNQPWASGYPLWGNNFAQYGISHPSHPSIQIGSCRVYNRGLSDAEILQNYQMESKQYGI